MLEKLVDRFVADLNVHIGAQNAFYYDSKRHEAAAERLKKSLTALLREVSRHE